MWRSHWEFKEWETIETESPFESCVTQEMSVTQERIWLFVCLLVGFFFTCRKPQMHLIKTVQLWIRWVSKALLCQYPISIFPFQQPYISFWIGWENLSMFWWGNTRSLLSFFLFSFTSLGKDIDVVQKD